MVSRSVRPALLGMALLALTGCASAPSTFVEVTEPGWTAIEIRDGVEFEDAWQDVVDVVAKRLEPEMISKDGGYIRTKWSYTWTGVMLDDYRVRAIVKFSPDRDVVEVRTDAEYGTGAGRVVGTDTSLLKTLKTDIMGVVGRTTR